MTFVIHWRRPPKISSILDLTWRLITWVPHSFDSNGGDYIKREYCKQVIVILKEEDEKMIVYLCLWLGILSREIQIKSYKKLIEKIIHVQSKPSKK